MSDPNVAVTPAGPLGLAMQNLRLLIAGTAAWQAWTGADATDDPAAAALAHVHLIGLPPAVDSADYTPAELGQLRPYAIVDLGAMDDSGRDFMAQRIASVAFKQTGRLSLYIAADVPPHLKDHWADAKLDFLNRLGALVQDLLLDSGIDAALSVHGIRLLDGPVRSATEELPTIGDAYFALLEVTYGP